MRKIFVSAEYFVSIIFLLSLAAIVSIFVIQVHHTDELFQRPSWWIRLVFFEYLSRLLLLHSMVAREEHLVQERRRKQVK